MNLTINSIPDWFYLALTCVCIVVIAFCVSVLYLRSHDPMIHVRSGSTEVYGTTFYDDHHPFAVLNVATGSPEEIERLKETMQEQWFKDAIERKRKDGAVIVLPDE